MAGSSATKARNRGNCKERNTIRAPRYDLINSKINFAFCKYRTWRLFRYIFAKGGKTIATALMAGRKFLIQHRKQFLKL